MLNCAHAKGSVAEPITFMSADATDLPFDSESFDMVVCRFGVRFRLVIITPMPDLEKCR
jgi:ubiquinone/menaquinone biosynthesis C-methylase UbiE